MKPSFATLTTLFVSIGAVASLLVLALDRSGAVPALAQPVNWTFRWLVLLGAGLLLLGGINLLWVHLQRIRTGDSGWINSLALVVTLMIVVGGGLASPAGVRSPFVGWIFNYLIIPGEGTLYALLAFFLAVAGYRQLRISRTGGAWMLAGALLVLLTQAPFASASWPASLMSFTDWLVDVPVMASLRGVLLGSSVAVLILGLQYALGRR